MTTTNTSTGTGAATRAMRPVGGTGTATAAQRAAVEDEVDRALAAGRPLPGGDLSQLNRAPVAHLAWHAIRHGARPFDALDVAHRLVASWGTSRRIDDTAARAMYLELRRRTCPAFAQPAGGEADPANGLLIA